MEKLTAEKIWAAYDKGNRFNDSLNLKDDVEKNEDFYIGNQWRNVNAPNLDHPVLNFIKRVINYFISMIITNDVAVNITPFLKTADTEMQSKILKTEVERIFEHTQTKTLLRRMLRNCAVDGDGCFYIYWDGKKGRYGDPEIEVIENTKVIFGNPFCGEAQKQPYIIVVTRKNLKDFRKELEKRGFPKEKLGEIQPDGGENHYGEEHGDYDLVTELIYMWKEENKEGKETVHFIKSTRTTITKEETDTGYTLYPVAWLPWDIRQNNYHGQSPITGLIPNQLFVNKLWAMAMAHCQNMAFPKILFDQTKIRKWSNKAGEALGVVGDPTQAFASTFKAADMSTQVLQLVQNTIEYTKDFMGANDAALGNVTPENTSAIIAVQQAATAPLELQRNGYHQFIEDAVRILIEMMRVNYGIREVSFTDDNGDQVVAMLDFGKIDFERMQLNIDVGAGSYFNEITQVNTADKLIQNGIITDAILYLEAIPDKYIFNKAKIIAKLKEQQALQEAQMLAMQGMPVEGQAPIEGMQLRDKNEVYDPAAAVENARARIEEAIV